MHFVYLKFSKFISRAARGLYQKINGEKYVCKGHLERVVVHLKSKYNSTTLERPVSAEKLRHNMQGRRQEGEGPCPQKIVDDTGQAFLMGCGGGAVYHFLRGLKNAPKGHRFNSGYASMATRAPATGGGFAIWGGLFSVYHCALVAVRHKEDKWNSCLSGGLVGGTLALRAGWIQAGKGAFVGFCLLGLLEGMVYMMQKAFSPNPSSQPEIMRLDDEAPSFLDQVTGGRKATEAPRQKVVDLMDDFEQQYSLRTFTVTRIFFSLDEISNITLILSQAKQH
jgi:import inner membrane translocase subunit TIM17